MLKIAQQIVSRRLDAIFIDQQENLASAKTQQSIKLKTQ
jgi:hypothetical protein